MDELLTVGVIAVLFMLIHLAFAAYLYRSLSANRDGNAEATERVRRADSGEKSGTDELVSGTSNVDQTDERSTVPCPTCGTPNDPSFQFCRRCVSDLSERAATPNQTPQPRR